MSRLRAITSSPVLAAVLYSTIPAVLVLGIDLALRGSDLVFPTPEHAGLYALSVVATAGFWLLVGSVAARLADWQRALAWVFVGLVGFAEGLVLVGSYTFYEQFSVLPNVYGFEFIYEETEDAAAFFAGGATLAPLLAWGLVACSASAYLVAPLVVCRPMTERLGRGLRRRATLVGSLLLVLGTAPVLHNNVPKFPNAFLPEVHTAYSWTKATALALGGHTKSIRLLGSGTRPNLRTDAGELSFDVLFIFNESVRRRNLSIFGYERDTTPNMKRFLEERAGRSVLFDRCYATSTRSLLAFPSFLTGAHPVQPGSVMHTQPLIFDYAKLFSNVDTFVIASHSYAWGNFIDFIRTPSLDYLYYREVSGLEPSHGTGIDDANVPAQLVTHLGRMDPRRRFVGLLHFYGTHQEYDSRAEDRLWGVEAKIDRYDASIHYLDRNIAAVLDALGNAGRLDDTLIIFASDHGEAFGEKGYDGHLRTYYDVEARVPLWIHLPRGLMTDRSVIEGLRRNADRPVSNADLVPTFLALTGLDRYAEIRAQTKRLLGRSIAGELPPDRPLLMQNYNDAGSNAMYVGVGLLEGRYKYLLRVEGGRSWEELYDLAADPEEATNIWSTAGRSLRDSLHRELRTHRNSRVVAEKYLPKEEER